MYLIPIANVYRDTSSAHTIIAVSPTHNRNKNILNIHYQVQYHSDADDYFDNTLQTFLSL